MYLRLFLIKNKCISKKKYDYVSKYLPNDFLFSFKHASYEKNIGDAIQISNSSSLTVDSLASWQFEAWSV